MFLLKNIILYGYFTYLLFLIIKLICQYTERKELYEKVNFRLFNMILGWKLNINLCTLHIYLMRFISFFTTIKFKASFKLSTSNFIYLFMSKCTLISKSIILTLNPRRMFEINSFINNVLCIYNTINVNALFLHIIRSWWMPGLLSQSTRQLYAL